MTWFLPYWPQTLRKVRLLAVCESNATRLDDGMKISAFCFENATHLEHKRQSQAAPSQK
jgi:hypothetical protein